MKRRLLNLMVLSMVSMAGAAQKPNVILIMTDDQGYGDMSAHVSPVLKTPGSSQTKKAIEVQ